MSAPNVVIVESPAKAKTIEKFLGSDLKLERWFRIRGVGTLNPKS